MSNREQYMPGPATGAEVKKDGETWTLVLKRQLKHSPERVWAALTEPEQLREWAPFNADRDMGQAGAIVRMTTVGAPGEPTFDTTVTRAEAPKLLEYSWSGNPMRWELEEHAGGTRLTLWASIGRQYIAMGAAGWHICLDVLDHLLSGEPLGRMAGMPLMQFSGWQRLFAEYSQQFGVEMPKWGG